MKKTTGTDRATTRQWRPATQAVRGGTGAHVVEAHDVPPPLPQRFPSGAAIRDGAVRSLSAAVNDSGFDS